MPGLGLIVNICAIVVGTLAGLAFGRLITPKTRKSATQVIGLAVIVFGLSGALSALTKLGKTHSIVGTYASVVVVAALVIGTMLGEWMCIEDGFEALGLKLKKLLRRRGVQDTDELPDEYQKAGTLAEKPEVHEKAHGIFVEGFVTASLIYVVGAMSIVGSIQDGLGNPDTLFLKAALDGFTSIFLASTLGVGVGFSILPVGIFQGAIMLLSLLAGNIIPPLAITTLEAVGGVIIAAIGMNMTGVRRFPVGNMLPALLLALLAGWVLV